MVYEKNLFQGGHNFTLKDNIQVALTHEIIG